MKISDVMTPCPHFISSKASLDEAMNKMQLRSIRHLPVVDNGELLGVLSERDVLLSQMVCKATNYCPTVGDTCVGTVYAVKSDQEVADVAHEMAESKLDCAIIIDEKEAVVGIFTSTDAFRLLHLSIRET